MKVMGHALHPVAVGKQTQKPPQDMGIPQGIYSLRTVRGCLSAGNLDRMGPTISIAQTNNIFTYL